MSLLTPDQTVQLIKNGHRPDDDHMPVVLLQARHDDEVLMQFLLTHVDPDHPEQAYGLADYGNGKPRLTIMFIPQLESANPRYDLKVEPDATFEPQASISVYAEAARQVGKITTGQAALQWAKTHLEFTKAKDKFTAPLRSTEGPAFLPFNPN